jgi:4-amino-4-deoxy-L-arabinose transferase-like glycosyltransferase
VDSTTGSDTEQVLAPNLGVDAQRAAGPPASRRHVRRGWALDFAAVGLLAVLARLPWALLVHGGATSDSYFYYLGARSISEGHGYSIMGHPTAFFPVGWPAFLAGIFLIVGPSVAAIKAVNLVLWALSAVLACALGRQLGGRAVGLVSGVLVAVSPTMTPYVMRASSEALFIPLLLAVCLLLIRRDEATPSLPKTALAGVLLGLAILVRSTAMLLPLALPLWLLLRRRPLRESWRSAALLAVASVLVLVPWAVRNSLVMHTVGLSTNGGYTIWIGANPLATGGFDIRGGHHMRWAILSAAAEKRQNSTLLHESITYVREHPVDWLELMPAKFSKLMAWGPGPFRNVLIAQRGLDPQRGRYERQLSGTESTLINGSLRHLWLYKLWHYSYWILGGIALLLATRKRLPGAGLAALLVSFWIVFHVVFVHGEARYMLSVEPLVAPALAWLLVAGIRGAVARASSGSFASLRKRATLS